MQMYHRRPAEPETREVNHCAPRDIRRNEHNVQECMLVLLKRLKGRGSPRFAEVFSDAPTKEEVVTLISASAG